MAGDSPDSSAGLLAGKTVLLCEDEGMVVMHVSRALRQCKCELITARTASEAIETARQHRPELVLTDISLPDESGIEAARHILNEIGEYKPCQVFLTAVSEQDSHSAVAEMDACGYLVKPVMAEHVIRALEAAWQGWNDRAARSRN